MYSVYSFMNMFCTISSGVIALKLKILLPQLSGYILREYERWVVFRLGRLIPVKGPGLVIIIPLIDRLVKVGLRIVAMDVPVQDIITKDNVTVKVNAFQVHAILGQAYGHR